MLMTPIGTVAGGRSAPHDDDWAVERALIRLDPAFDVDALAGLTDFSHLEVVFVCHLVEPDDVCVTARGNPDWPRVGIFAQRARNRPNRLGVSRCRLLGVDGLDIHVAGLDAIDGTPVLDVKPYLVEFGPAGPVTQPAWATELMRAYY